MYNFHPLLCSCVILENQNSQNQSSKTHVVIDLLLLSLQWKYFFSFSSFLWNNLYDFSAFLIQYLKMAFFSSFPSYFRFSNQSGHPELSMYIFCLILLKPTYLCRLVFRIADADFWLPSFMYRLQEIEILVQVFWCT